MTTDFTDFMNQLTRYVVFGTQSSQITQDAGYICLVKSNGSLVNVGLEMFADFVVQTSDVLTVTSGVVSNPSPFSFQYVPAGTYSGLAFVGGPSYNDPAMVIDFTSDTTVSVGTVLTVPVDAIEISFGVASPAEEELILTTACKNHLANLMAGVYDETVYGNERYVGLLNSSGVEVSGGGYERVRLDTFVTTPSYPNRFESPVAGYTENKYDLEWGHVFSPLQGDLPTFDDVTYAAIFPTSSGSNEMGRFVLDRTLDFRAGSYITLFAHDVYIEAVSV